MKPLFFLIPLFIHGPDFKVDTNLRAHYYADTIIFENVVFPTLEKKFNSKVVHVDGLKGLIFRSVGTGKSVWIDSLVYEYTGSKGFFLIAKVAQGGVAALSYNGDSLKVDVFDLHAIDDYRVSTKENKQYSYVRYSYQIWNFGSRIRLVFYFKLGKVSGKLLNRRAFFTVREPGADHFNFTMSDSLGPDHLIIRKYFPGKRKVSEVDF